MPFIHVMLVVGRSEEEKMGLIKAYTDNTARILDIDPSKVTVVLDEIPPERWAKADKRVFDS